MMDRMVPLISVLMVFFGGVTSLRDVRLLVQPSSIIRGATAALICSRDMQNAPLYSVKWYRGNHEFYRFTPMETPDTRVFTIPGIYVDFILNNSSSKARAIVGALTGHYATGTIKLTLDPGCRACGEEEETMEHLYCVTAMSWWVNNKRSNGSQVLLRRLDLGMAGNFSCEVTADSPSFATQIAYKFIDVIALPAMDPVLKADKDRYQPGEILRANCSSSPARPSANLTIFINDEPLRSSETSLHPSDTGLLWTSVNAELKVTPELFPSGRLRVACVAKVYEVYKSAAHLDFFTPETDPRPERSRSNDLVTLNGATKCFQSWILLILLLFLPMVVMGQVNDFDAYFSDISDYELSEENRDPSVMSMIGG